MFTLCSFPKQEYRIEEKDGIIKIMLYERGEKKGKISKEEIARKKEKEKKEWIDKTYKQYYEDRTITSTQNGGVCVIVDSNGKIAKAKCHPDDRYDERIGFSIAYARLRNLPIPNFFLSNREFKVGDIVIGNKKANKHYVTTKEGWVGKVIKVRKDGIEVEGMYKKETFVVSPRYFDLY